MKNIIMPPLSKIFGLLVLLVGTTFSNEALASENDPFAYKEIKAVLASEKNLIHFNRVSGMLADILKEQKRNFTKNKGTGKNKTTIKAEELMNEASLSASQGDYKKAFKILDNAHELIMDSIKEMLK